MRKGFIWLKLPDCSISLKEVRTGNQPEDQTGNVCSGYAPANATPSRPPTSDFRFTGTLLWPRVLHSSASITHHPNPMKLPCWERGNSFSAFKIKKKKKNHDLSPILWEKTRCLQVFIFFPLIQKENKKIIGT